MNMELRAFSPRLGSETGQLFESCYELRPAIGVAAIVDRVHTDKNVAHVEHFRPGKGVAEKNRVTCRNVGERNVVLFARSSLRDGNLIGQCRATKNAKINFSDPMATGAEGRCDFLSGNNFAAVT